MAILCLVSVIIVKSLSTSNFSLEIEFVIMSSKKPLNPYQHKTFLEGRQSSKDYGRSRSSLTAMADYSHILEVAKASPIRFADTRIDCIVRSRYYCQKV